MKASLLCILVLLFLLPPFSGFFAPGSISQTRAHGAVAVRVLRPGMFEEEEPMQIKQIIGFVIAGLALVLILLFVFSFLMGPGEKIREKMSETSDPCFTIVGILLIVLFLAMVQNYYNELLEWLKTFGIFRVKDSLASRNPLSHARVFRLQPHPCPDPGSGGPGQGSAGPRTHRPSSCWPPHDWPDSEGGEAGGTLRLALRPGGDHRDTGDVLVFGPTEAIKRHSKFSEICGNTRKRPLYEHTLTATRSNRTPSFSRLRALPRDRGVFVEPHDP